MFSQIIKAKGVRAVLRIAIPGFKTLELAYLVLDYNGTLALDGNLLPAVEEQLQRLATQLEIHILTADTFGRVREACAHLPAKIRIVGPVEGNQEKEEIIKQLGAEHVVAIGNGYNDWRMMQSSGLGILVIGPEGCAARSLLNADVVVKSIEEALDLLLFPQRLVATLRS